MITYFNFFWHYHKFENHFLIWVLLVNLYTTMGNSNVKTPITNDDINSLVNHKIVFQYKPELSFNYTIGCNIHPLGGSTVATNYKEDVSSYFQIQHLTNNGNNWDYAISAPDVTIKKNGVTYNETVDLIGCIDDINMITMNVSNGNWFGYADTKYIITLTIKGDEYTLTTFSKPFKHTDDFRISVSRTTNITIDYDEY